MYSKNLTAPVSNSRLSAHLLMGVLFVNLFMCVIIGLILYQSYRQYDESAQISTRNLAHILEESLGGSLDEVNVVLLAISDEMNRQFILGKIDEAGINTFLARMQDRMPELNALRIADEHGIVKYGRGVVPGSKVDVTDRKYFIYLRAHNEFKPYISEPVFGYITKKWELPIVHRLNHPDGSFAGVVYAFISLDDIRQSFADLNVGKHGIINLRDEKMNIIVRYPEPLNTENAIGKNTMSPQLQELLQAGKEIGTYRIHSVLDNFERTYSYRKIAGYPLYVTVAFAVDDYLAEWRDFSIKLITITVLFLFITSSTVWYLHMGEKRRKLTLRELEILNRDFLTLLESTTDFIYFKDKESRIRFCSQTLANITGHHSWREMIGKHDTEIFPADTARIYYEEELPVFRDGTPILNHIDPFYDEQGKQGWVSTNKWPVFDDDGKTVVGLFGISRDISEFRRAEMALRESEQRFRNMFHNHSSCMILVDPEGGTIVDANAAAAGFYGYSVDELRGMLISRINTLSEDQLRLERQQALDQQRNHFTFPHRLANGEIRTVEVFSTPINNNGKILLFSIVYDVTERKNAEHALQRSNNDLERFAYSVSHDMRQPLRAVSGHLQLLQRSLKDKMDDNDRENLDFALDGARRMDSMIVSLLDYSRVGRKTVSKNWIESRGSLDEALGFLAPMIAEKKAEIRLSGEWPQVFASSDELTRLFQNLIANAIKFRDPEQSELVEIDSSIRSSTWRVSVRDYGVGVEPTQKDRLFQFFSRLESRNRFEGTGMGLALCKRIVEHHGGRIWVESEGKSLGSTFIFEINVPTRDVVGA